MTAKVLLINPKYPHNVGGAYRAAACFGATDVYVHGDRVPLESREGYRLPREERLRAYNDEVNLQELHHMDHIVRKGFTPIAVEVSPNAEQLHHFEHPENAIYLFGPEDGSIPKGWRHACHRFVVIPSFHCLNLAGVVYTVLYDRVAKRRLAHYDPEIPSNMLMSGEMRGYKEHYPEVPA